MFTSKFFGINTYAALISADSKQFSGKLNSSESTLTRNRGGYGKICTDRAHSLTE
jgi:hypothetical protein